MMNILRLFYQRGPEISRVRLISVLRDRSFTIGIANALLLLVCVALSMYSYGSTFVGRSIWPDFTILGFIAIVGLFASIEGPSDRVYGSMNIPTNAEATPTGSGTEGNEVLHQIGYRYWRLVFALFFLIILDFYAMGRLINATGGWEGSPFGQVPIIMLVIGAVMAYQPRTRLVLLIVGFLYLLVLAQFDSIIWTRHPLRGSHITVDVLLITFINLVISFVVIARREVPSDPPGDEIDEA